MNYYYFVSKYIVIIYYKLIMEKKMDEVELKRSRMIQSHNQEMSDIKIGIQMLRIDEVPDAVRTALLDEINYSFTEKWNYYRKEMQKLNDEINELKKYY